MRQPNIRMRVEVNKEDSTNKLKYVIRVGKQCLYLGQTDNINKIGRLVNEYIWDYYMENLEKEPPTDSRPR